MKKYLFILIIAIFTYQGAEAQVKGLTDFGPEKIFQQAIENSALANQLNSTEKYAVGNSVRPEYYFIGPGDILGLNAIPIYPSEQIIEVTSDNFIFIPRIGAIDVSGMTLSQVRDSINKMLRSRSENIIATISLKRPRTVMVSIRGNILQPGNYTLPSAYSVSSAIKFANQSKASTQMYPQQAAAMLKIQSEQQYKDKIYSESGLSQKNVYSERNIIIYHNDGKTSKCDLEKAKANGDQTYDPYIREGDDIYIPFEAKDYPTVSINGAVLRPCSMVLKDGDKLSMLLKAGYGLADNADIGSVELLIPGQAVKFIQIDSALNLLSEDIQLTPGISILIPEKDRAKIIPGGGVSVKGFVAKPGVFPITPGKTRLKDVISMAGGITSEAYLPLAYILRKENGSLSTTNNMMDFMQYFQYSDLTLEDTVRYGLDMSLKRPYVSCDLEAALNGGREDQNVLLEDGDVIVIPSNPGKVYVFGQVNSPGYIAFSEKKTLEWYVEKAGGFGNSAKPSRARIIRGRTLVWDEGGSDIYVNAGDMIYVPRPPDIPKSVEVQNYSIVASIILAAVSIASIVINILKTN